MIINPPNSVAFSIFGFPVFWYGIILACAVFVGILFACFIAKEPEKTFIYENSPLMIICGILGARLYYCALNFSYYFKNPVDILNIREGGLSIHGMIITGVVLVYFLAKKHKVNFLKLLDCLMCAMPLAQSIGRWGNFFNSEAFGMPTNGNWGLFVPPQNRPYPDIELYHPTFLYESCLDLCIFFVLFYLFKKNLKSGKIFFSYLILYSICRIIVEFIRVDSALDIFGIPIAVIVSVILLLIGLVGLIKY